MRHGLLGVGWLTGLCAGLALLALCALGGCDRRPASPAVGEWELDVEALAASAARGLAATGAGGAPVGAEDLRREFAALRMSFRLDADGTCLRRQAGRSARGSWALRDGVLTLTGTEGKPWLLVARLDGDRLLLDSAADGAAAPPGLPTRMEFRRR